MDDLSPGINFNKIIDKKNSPTFDDKKEIKSRIRELEEEEISLMKEFNLPRVEFLPKIHKIGEIPPIKIGDPLERIDYSNKFATAFSRYYGIDIQNIPSSFAKLIDESTLSREFKWYGPHTEVEIDKIVDRFEMLKRFDEYGETLRTSFMDVSTLSKDYADELYDNLMDCIYSLFNSIDWRLSSTNINIYSLKLMSHILCRKFYVKCPTGGILKYDELDGVGQLFYVDVIGNQKIVDLQWLRQLVRLHIDLPTKVKDVIEFRKENGGVICVRLVLLILSEDSNFELVVTDDYDKE